MSHKRKKTRRKKQTENRRSISSASRISSLIVIFCVAMFACFSATVYVMAARKHIMSGQNALDSRIYNSLITQTLSSKRGEILDRNGKSLAQEGVAYTITANFDTRTEQEKQSEELTEKRRIEGENQAAAQTGRTEQVDAQHEAEQAEKVGSYVTDIPAFAKAVKSILGDDVDEDRIVELLEAGQKNGRAQIELGTGTKKISKANMEKLASLKIDGMGFIEETKRIYPVSPISSLLIGFADTDAETGLTVGKMGLENNLNAYLAGTDGEKVMRISQDGTILAGSEKVLSSPVNGYNVRLTLDSNLQQVVEEQMQKTMEKNKAKYAWCLVMDPETGKILAWASYPSFDQNSPKVIEDSWNHISGIDMEVGSVIKPLVFSMAINNGTFPYNETYRAGSFAYTVDEQTGEITRVSDQSQTNMPVIHDALGNDYGTLSYEDGLAHSSNIAMCMLLSNYLTVDEFKQYMDAYGFFKETGIEYVPEAVGTAVLSTATDYLSSGFGQASRMTPLQLCQAYTAIFNDGNMMKPYVVESISDPETGKTLQSFEPTVAGTPISSSTASQVRQMMKHVMDPDMTGERFAIEGVDMIGKTGTGEVYNEETGTYDTKYYTSSVIAAAPADDPKVMVYWGMESANYLEYSADEFQTIFKQALNTVGVGSAVNTAAPEERRQTSDMPSLVNHTVGYAEEKLKDRQVNTVLIGDGNTIIDQFPKAGVTINTNDNVLLLSDGSNIVMPDMTGWTRKDVEAFSQITGIAISFEGFGKAASQSVEPGTPLEESSTVEVQLE